MRVLVSCISAHGHLQPLLPLVRALADAGHEIAIATGPSMQSRARATGFTTFEAGIDAQAAFERLAEVFPDQEYNRLAPDEILDWYIPHLFGEILAPAMLADLEPLAQSWRPDVILHDIWELAAPIAAAHLGIPSVSQALGIRFSNSMIEAAAKAVAPLWQQRRLEPEPTAGIYRHLCLDITPPTLQPYEPAPYYDAIRPLRPIAPPPIPGERLPVWIEQRRAVPLVHMTLGTNFSTNSDLSMFRSVIEGLGNLEMDIAITIGFEVAPTSFEPLPDNVHIESYLPHSLLLPHCAAVICHGGPGTTLSALALGLPLLVLPQGADQYIVGDLVQRVGAGLRLVPSEVTPSNIRSSVLALLHERIYQSGARRLQREIAAMPGPDEGVHLIEEVVHAQR